MNVEELINKLKKYNPKAEVSVIAHCRDFNFTISTGGSEGIDDSDCESVSFYVDELCTNERSNNEG